MTQIRDLEALLRTAQLPASAGGWLRHIQAVNERYLELDRCDTAVPELRRVKFTMLAWRRWALGQILDTLRNDPRDGASWADALSALRIHIPAEMMTRLQTVLDDAEFARLAAGQGRRVPGFPDQHRAAGPGRTLPIQPNKGSRWPFARWSRFAEFSEYRMHDQEVFYRGCGFRPGDILVTDVNRDGNGLYTCLSDPGSYGSHSGFVALLPAANGRRCPCVMETFERGVRPVPLNVFTDPSFSSYVEVYRHVEAGPEHWDAINRAAAAMIDGVLGYNFYTEDPDPTYLSCTRVGTEMLAAAGLATAGMRSRISNPRIRENLVRLGYPYETYFAPVDYMRDPALRRVGWLDNNHFVKMLCRAWVDEHVREQFSTRQVDLSRLPLNYRINYWGIGQIQRRTILGRAISRVEGFDADTLPRGPRRLMALIQVAEAQLARGIDRLFRKLQPSMAVPDPTDMDRLEGFSELRESLDRHLRLRWLA